ncbi:glycosyltransferase family 2 protein [Clostridium sp. C105KSO13]|uniref:glycosyltransferase family 2 protein n=1 Tax=Clostridium sp. C105KSO13 TaxID=1776045 RepID=UPI00074065D0|nr:glycosyltransferase family 2 protein [Clostridium sp. C105KSO13]CUX33733.1 Hyaluronan synthase [Clostridium sp. C105KSO13]
MKNKFVVTACRFHTKEKNKILIMGWFWENQMNDNHISILLDQRKLSFTAEERDAVIGELKSKDGMLITKKYYLWAELPSNWKESKKLYVINTCQGKDDTSCIVPTTKLVKIEQRIPRFIDKGSVSGNGFRISGWYINDGNVKISFRDPSGKEYPVDLKRKKRPDVLLSYPEASDTDVVGFTAVYKGTVPKRVKVELKSGSKETDHTVTLIPSPAEKKLEKLKNGYRKTKVYYHQYGPAETVRKLWGKAAKRENISYKLWLKMQTPSKSDLEDQRRVKFEYMPKISIVVPLYKTPEKYLAEMMESVLNQTYSNWELCLSDGSGADSTIQELLKKYVGADKRIKVVSHEKPLQISDNTNAALEIATGDYIAFADHDDLLAPHALYECVYELNKDKDIDILYTDEDKVDMNGREHFMPHFKPDFNIDMLRSVNYICHLFVVKREIYEKAGMLDQKFDGAQDYDFVLRCIEKTKNIKHIPMVLYHWRAHKDSTAENPKSKRYAFEAGKRAIEAHYKRLGILAEVSATNVDGIYRTKYILTEKPMVSVVIPNKDHIGDLDKCIRSLQEKNEYENMEYIIVENNSTEKETFAYYEELVKNEPKAKVVFWKEEGFNYPAINNLGVKEAKGEYILFLNNDTEILHADCIEELLGYCMRKDVGAVGARLYYEDGTIQHAGVIVGLGGIAGHAFVGYSYDDPGYFGRIMMAQDYSAVTAACMMVKRTVFEEVGGFDEGYAVAFNDIDLCLKIRRAGYLIVYNPYAELKHYESKSRGYEDTEEKVMRFNSEMERFSDRWSSFLEEGDPFYSPNLTLDKNDFSLNVNMRKTGGR